MTTHKQTSTTTIRKTGNPDTAGKQAKVRTGG